MQESEVLIADIRTAFGHIPFPEHRGLLAAVLMDDWISDEKVLADATKQRDYAGDWWDVPEEHVSGESLGFNYLDAWGVEFYLPAFMTLAIEKPIYRNQTVLIDALQPRTRELYDYFCDKLSRITGAKKKVTRRFLEYLRSDLIRIRNHDLKRDNYAYEAKVHYAHHLIARIDGTLSHEFWRSRD